MIEGISAVTLGTHEMPRAVRFYRALGFEVLHGGEESSFTSLRAGAGYLNLIIQPAERRWSWWGRVIFYVADVDALYDRALAAGNQPTSAPRDAEWGERFFHLNDPTVTNSVSLDLCSRLPSNSSSKGPAIPRGVGNAYGAPIIR
jgi:catechol 2,3-dioxygenase-like lactoylglutathione lyase family enzyme